MAKVQIKSEKLSPFGFFFSIIEHFDALLAQTMGEIYISLIYFLLNIYTDNYAKFIYCLSLKFKGAAFAYSL